MKGGKAMCIVKTKENVVNRSDLQDLVTSIISVNLVPFTEEEVYNEIKPLLKGSKFEKDCQLIKSLIYNTLKVLFYNNYIRNDSNKFYIYN